MSNETRSRTSRTPAGPPPAEVKLGVSTPVEVELPDNEKARGVIVEDFADSTVPAHTIEREWALPRRWGVALDDGRLVFVDGDHIKAAAQP
ncbi:hypothetical protein [Rhodococcus sp. 27YEA15]|uniref:hypothetical protein n=1 Tax=Rhodococcus sp. 27YEA15 TaxID=3156259 RepID=UPI003C7D5882